MTHVYAFDHPHGLPLPEVKALIGSKAANIAVMATELGLPVPPGVHDRPRRPARRTSPTAGRRGWTPSCASTWPASRRSSAGASATRRTRCW